MRERLPAPELTRREAGQPVVALRKRIRARHHLQWVATEFLLRYVLALTQFPLGVALAVE
jgi:hypothetical protein